MPNRTLLAAMIALVLVWGAAPTAAQEAAAKPAVASFAGSYEVKGTTVVKTTGERRDIKGTIVLSQEGDEYKSTFSLKTIFPFVEATVEADVIGTGEGKIQGTTLRGTARTQIVMSTVPGIDPSFAFVPRTVGPRIVSTNVGRLEEDGSITIEIESRPAAGETYVATHTTLRGARVSPGPTVDAAPNVAAPPAEAPEAP